MQTTDGWNCRRDSRSETNYLQQSGSVVPTPLVVAGCLLGKAGRRQIRRLKSVRARIEVSDMMQFGAGRLCRKSSIPGTFAYSAYWDP